MRSHAKHSYSHVHASKASFSDDFKLELINTIVRIRVHLEAILSLLKSRTVERKFHKIMIKFSSLLIINNIIP